MSNRRDLFSTLLLGAIALPAVRAIADELPFDPGGLAGAACCPVVELRQYTIRGGRRNDFMRLFGGAFVAPQRACGIRVLGWFADADDADRFVWMRGFPDMESRAASLAAFYGGDIWKSHKEEANSMIVDSDNVLLLRPVRDGEGIGPFGRGMDEVASVYIQYLSSGDIASFDTFYNDRILPRIRNFGGALMGSLCSHEGPNSFPRLPVRIGETAFASFVRFKTEAERALFERQLRAASGGRDDAPDPLLADLMRKPELLRLRNSP